MNWKGFGKEICCPGNGNIRHNDTEGTSSTINKHIQKEQILTEVQWPVQLNNSHFFHKISFKILKNFKKTDDGRIGRYM
jgi:hypothetical protein